MISNGVKNSYALLGLSFLIVFGGAYILLSQKVLAPSEEVLEDNVDESMAMALTSSAFGDGELIPSKYTCDGENISPPLSIEGVPEGTESLVLVMDDSDIPEEIKQSRGIEKFDHWAVYNLSADTTELPENLIGVPAGLGAWGKNSSGKSVYTGPCPPSEYEPTEHRYIFRLYALSGQLNFIQEPTLDEIEKAAQKLMLEQTELLGRYDRTK